MARSGSYRMYRDWMDNPVFGGSRNEPYCRRAAWIWLIEHARYEDGEMMIAGKPVLLRRGQLSYSYRYLAAAWGWSEAKVRRYCVAVASAKMISCDTDAGQAVITICNYDKYQPAARVDDADEGASVTQHRRSTDANIKKREERYTKDPDGSLAETLPAEAAPEPAEEPAFDAQTVVINRCVSWMAKATGGKPERSFRAWVVKLLREYGDGAVVEAFTKAARAPPFEPKSWIEGTLRRGKVNGKRIDPITGWFAGFNEVLNERDDRRRSPDREHDREVDGPLLGSGHAN